jgi:hypothetical protein
VIRATGLFCYIPGIGVRGQLVNSHRGRGIQQSRKHSDLGKTDASCSVVTLDWEIVLSPDEV